MRPARDVPDSYVLSEGPEVGSPEELGRTKPNLLNETVWSTVVALKPLGRPVDRNAEFVDRIRREFAELNGVDIGNVTVNLVINLLVNDDDV